MKIELANALERDREAKFEQILKEILLELEDKDRKITLKDEQRKAVKQLHHWTYMHNEQPRLFGLCAFALFTVRWANLFQPHVRWLILKFGHVTGRIFIHQSRHLRLQIGLLWDLKSPKVALSRLKSPKVALSRFKSP